MWTRKELKKQAKQTYRRHAWRFIAVCFVMVFLLEGYAGMPQILISYDESKEVEEVVDENIIPQSNSEVMSEMLENSHAFQAVDQAGGEAVTKREKVRRGVLGALFDSVTKSGSFLFGVLDSINQGVFQGKIMEGSLILFGMLLYLMYWIFGATALEVGQCRFFLESLAYEETPVGRVMFLYRIGRVTKVANVMLWKTIYQTLWSLTIVGGMIKHYSYMMIPYILAENPDVGRKDAFRISKRLMKGNKWKAFMLDLSFFGWDLLGVLTLGISNILFLEPYTHGVRAALYMSLRKEALEKSYEEMRQLNDIYLEYEPRWGKEKITVYPVEFFTIPELERRQWMHVAYRRDYSLVSYILLFFSFSVLGWFWEVALHLVQDGTFVNRGVLHGPWLPIYGTGGVLILFLLKRVRERPGLTFLLTVVICGCVEYFTSYFLEVTKHTKWWDYSGYLLNLNGRICAEGLIVFGLGGCGFIYVLAPVLDDLYKKIPKRIKTALCVLLLVGFLVDQCYSYVHPNTGKGITDYDAANPSMKTEYRITKGQEQDFCLFS